MALILSSLIVGASLLMRVPTRITLLGYPILAVFFFLLAAAGGIALIWSIWSGDRKSKKKAEIAGGSSQAPSYQASIS